MNPLLIQYLGGFFLCLAVAFVYALTRKDTPAAIARHTLRVFLYLLAITVGSALLVMVLCLLAGKLR